MAAQRASVPVTVIDNSQASIDKGLKFAEKLLEKDVGKGRISKEDAAATRGRLTSSTKIEDLSDVDFVIEAVPVRNWLKELRCYLTRGRKFQTSSIRYSPNLHKSALHTPFWQQTPLQFQLLRLPRAQRKTQPIFRPHRELLARTL